MTEEQKESLQEIEEQLYTINARNISLPWIGMKKTPTMDEISQLNKLLGFIILEIHGQFINTEFPLDYKFIREINISRLALEASSR